jgi:hypothetical protein
VPTSDTLTRILVGLVPFLAVAGVLLLLVWLLQRRLVYLPFDRRVPPAATVLPGSRDLRLATSDGVELGAWLVPSRRSAPRGAAVVFNGNAGHRGYRARLGAALAGAGLDVLLFDYRGYGNSGGRPSEEGLLRDARAVREGLLSRSDVGPERLVYFGESLGSGVAVALAIESPPAGLILRSPFTSLVDIGRVHYPFLPVRLLLRDRYPSLERASRLACPSLVIAGGADRIVPATMSRRLYEALPEPKRFLLVEGIGHNDVELLDGPEMRQAMEAFLDDVLP